MALRSISGKSRQISYVCDKNRHFFQLAHIFDCSEKMCSLLFFLQILFSYFPILLMKDTPQRMIDIELENAIIAFQRAIGMSFSLISAY